MGLVTGCAGVLFFALASIPLAQVADRSSRRALISISIAFWSVMTIVAGRTTTFMQLALARVGLGVGEAASGPASQSMISDYFEPAERAAPLAWIAASVPMGLMASFMIGGAMSEALGWRATLLWIGVAGLVLSVVVAVTVREPVRGASEAGADTRVHDLGATLTYLWGLRSFRFLVLAASLDVFAGYVLLAWSPSFLMRVHDMGPTEVGAWLGLASGLGGVAGTFLGGGVAQRLGKRDPRWLLWVPAITCLSATPFAFLFLSLPATYAPYMFFGVMFFGPAMYGPVLGVTQSLAKVRMRALAAAVLMLVYSVLGVGLGPLTTGMLSDVLTPTLGEEAIRYAMGLALVGFVGSSVLFLYAAKRLPADLEGGASDA